MDEDNKLIITVKLTPKAADNRIQGWSTDEAGQPLLRVRVTTAPEKGKANKALIALLAKEWGLSKSQITITAGATSRLKTLAIENPSPQIRHKILP